MAYLEGKPEGRGGRCLSKIEEAAPNGGYSRAPVAARRVQVRPRSLHHASSAVKIILRTGASS